MITRLYSCIIQEILNISDTFNIRASKNPFVVWVISSNLCIPSTSQIQDMLSIVFNRRKGSCSVPNSPSLIRSKILKSTIPMFCCVSYCKSKAIRRTKRKIRFAFWFEWGVDHRFHILSQRSNFSLTNNHVICAEIISCIDFRCSCECTTCGGEHVSKSIYCCSTCSCCRDTVLLCIFTSLGG